MKTYWLTFGANDPRTYKDLGSSVTIVQFGNAVGTTGAPPGITQLYPGWYKFEYNVGVTNSVAFLVDGGATLPSDVRWIRGVLDPLDNLNFQVGSTLSSYGTTAFPSDLFGFAMRQSQWLEGNQVFTKSTGAWSVYDKGASTLLGLKTITNNTSGVTAIP